jgi:hypothetical protein
MLAMRFAQHEELVIQKSPFAGVGVVERYAWRGKGEGWRESTNERCLLRGSSLKLNPRERSCLRTLRRGKPFKLENIRSWRSGFLADLW